MIRHDIAIRFEDVDEQQVHAAVVAHHGAQPYHGDFFLPSKQLSGTAAEIVIDGTAAGLVVVADGILVICTLTPRAKRYDRQVMEQALLHFDVTQAYAASWDGHHIELFGSFAREIDRQAYQFELLDPDDLQPAPGPSDDLAGLTLTTATEADLPYLTGSGPLDDYSLHLPAGRVRIARLGQTEVGIGLVVPHALTEGVADLGMFTDEAARGKGIGRFIIAEAARECLGRGIKPVAGCWAQNWASRPTLEAAGLTCVGTIFRLALDPHTFRDGAAPLQ